MFKQITSWGLAGLLLWSVQVRADDSVAQHPKLPEVAQQIAQEFGMDLQKTIQTLGRAKLIPSIPRLVLPPSQPTAKNWAAYRARFVEPIRIRAGVRFWQEHAALLAKAEAQYGVPAEIMVGIIGVETLYGRDTGQFRAIDALATLALEFPPQHPKAEQRQLFFQKELGQLLKLCELSGQDVTTMKSSYAGAMGWPQFMPSSWRLYAVDFDGDGQIDLSGSVADVIGSVANYFAAFGWQKGLPTHYPVTIVSNPTDMETLLAPDIVPSFDANTLMKLGAQPHLPPNTTPDQKYALVALQNGGATPTYLVGTQNFYVVTRYNWSSYYALAVIELGQAIATERKKIKPQTSPKTLPKTKVL